MADSSKTVLVGKGLLAPYAPVGAGRTEWVRGSDVHDTNNNSFRVFMCNPCADVCLNRTRNITERLCAYVGRIRQNCSVRCHVRPIVD